MAITHQLCGLGIGCAATLGWISHERLRLMQHILVVDDDAEITGLLTEYLANFGYTTHAAADGTELLAHMAAHPIDMVVLDVMLPGADGITLARELRARSSVPIIMLTARFNPYDCVLGLEIGADDYMGKPFEPRELVARIRTVLRRRPAAHASEVAAIDEVIRFDGWTLHSIERHLVSPRGVVIPLSNAEFRLLCTFLRTPRRVFSRDQLMEQSRGRAMEAFDRSIDVLVSRLRTKLSDELRPSMIRTVRGAGYSLNVQSIRGQVGWSQ